MVRIMVDGVEYTNVMKKWRKVYTTKTNREYILWKGKRKYLK